MPKSPPKPGRPAAKTKGRQAAKPAPRRAAANSKPHPPKSDADCIVKDGKICGGSARIYGTRISVWILVNARRLGHDDQDLLEGYPFINAAQLAAAWRYAERHQAEIDEEIRSNTED